MNMKESIAKTSLLTFLSCLGIGEEWRVELNRLGKGFSMGTSNLDKEEDVAGTIYLRLRRKNDLLRFLASLEIIYIYRRGEIEVLRRGRRSTPTLSDLG